MAAPRKYPDELRERSIRLVLDAESDPATRTGAAQRIGAQLGINVDTLRGWVKQAEIDGGHRPGTTSRGLLQVRLTLDRWDVVLQGGCLRAQEVPRGVHARCRAGRSSW